MNNKRNHACCRGVRTNKKYSNMRSSAYHSGRSPDLLKSKNPDAPTVMRELEED
jgi:hypothetical protein